MWPFGRFSGAESKAERPRLRVFCSPSPHPSPPGEGETFSRALVIRPSSVVVCIRNEKQRSGDCNRRVRIFQRGASARPLLGERVGVRGTKQTPTLGARRLPEVSNFAKRPAEPGFPNLIMTEPQIDQAIERVRTGSVDDYRVVVAAYHQRLRA